MEKIRIVRKEGGSRVISVTGVIPQEWKAVEIYVKKATDEKLSVSIEKVK